MASLQATHTVREDSGTESELAAVTRVHAFQTASALAREGARLPKIRDGEGQLVADSTALENLPRRTVTTEEAAAILRVTPVTIRCYARKGRLLDPDMREPIRKIGDEWHIPLWNDGRPAVETRDLSRGGRHHRWAPSPV